MQTGVNHPFETFLSLHAAQADATVALCAALDLANADGDSQVPEWIHLLPAGEIRTGDNRGPFFVRNVHALMQRSLTAGDRLVIDENHATDLAAPRGEPAPARGWIVELQARQDGVWGKVDWTAAGRRLLAGKAYRGISPVIEHLADKSVIAIRRASLVNKPNLKGLTALHQERSMDLLAKLLAALNLSTATSEDALVAAVTSLHQQTAEATVALQAQLTPIAEAVGLAKDADATAVATAVTALMAAGKAKDGETVTALMAQIGELSGEVTALRETSARDKATAFVEGAIKARKVGVAPLREHYIAMHMEDPARVEKEIGAFVSLNSTHTGLVPEPAKDGKIVLTPEQKHAVALMGIDEAAYLKTLEAEGAAQTSF